MNFNLRTIRPALLAATLAASLTAPAFAHEYKLGAMKIVHPWTRATPGGAKVAGGYLTLTNTGTAPDRLVGGSVVNAAGFEIHEMSMEGGVMKMRALPNGIEIKPGETVKFEPGGYHLMFTQLKKPQKKGEAVRGKLTFERAGSIEVEFKVDAMGSRGGGHQGH
jgi:periplasmic copper chaperone A